MSEERFETLRFLEAMLFAAAEPLTEKVMAHRLPDDADVKGLIEELKGHYANRGVVLMQFEDRWAFRTAPDLSHRMSIERKVVRKLTRAAVETLAIIAYHQPVGLLLEDARNGHRIHLPLRLKCQPSGNSVARILANAMLLPPARASGDWNCRKAG